MTLTELIRATVDLLAAERIPYFVFGAVGMDVWAGPRSTHDLDVVVCVAKRGIPALAGKLRRLGFRVTRDLERKLSEGRIIQLALGRTGLDLKTCVTRHDLSALKRSKTVTIGSTPLAVATPEDLVLYKLLSWRIQDQADIEKIRKDVKDLDVRYLEAWLERLASATGLPVRERWRMAVRGIGGTRAGSAQALREQMSKLLDDLDRPAKE